MEKKIADLIARLSHSRLFYREKAIIKLGELGADARAALPHLEKLIESQGGRIRYSAMVAVMQIEGSRKFYRELAEAAGVYQRRGNEATAGFLRFDKGRAQAIISAIRIRDRNWQNLKPPHGLDAFLERLYESDAAGVEEMNERLIEATPEELKAWLVILRQMKPMPAGVAPALKRTILEGDAGERKQLIGLLAGVKSDASDLGREMAPFICEVAREAEPEFRGQLLSTLGNLGSKEPETVKLLVAGLREGGSVADGAAGSLTRLGTAARPAIEELIRVAASREPGKRTMLIFALLATKDRRVIPFLRKVLRDGNYWERRHVLENVHLVDGAADLAPEFSAIYEKVSLRNVPKLMYAAVRCDRGLARPETVTLLTRAFGEARRGSRRTALHMIQHLETLPAPVAASLAAALEYAREDVMVSGAQNAIRSAAKFGEAATAIVPVIVPLAADVRFESSVVQALTAIAPLAPESLAVFRRLANEGRARSTQSRAVLGMGKIEKPTKEDVAALEAVLASKGRRYSSVLRAATEILNRPKWKALRKP